MLVDSDLAIRAGERGWWSSNGKSNEQNILTNRLFVPRETPPSLQVV